jgi:hemoglobin-like flavoprotein
MTATINLILHSFELAAERCADLTPLVYRRLFREHPETQAMFRTEGSELVRSSMLALTIDSMLDFAGDRTGRFRMISCEVQSHDAYGTPRELFGKFFGVIAETVREVLGDDWSLEIDGAWRTLLDEIDAFVAQSEVKTRFGGVMVRDARRCRAPSIVMPGLVPGIHVLAYGQERRGWPGRSPAMTKEQTHVERKSHLSCRSLPLEEIRTDVGLLLDRIVVAIDAVGDQRVARNHRVFVGPDRVQSDHRGLGAAIPFEGGGARRLLAGRDGVREDIAFDEGFHGPQLAQGFPVHVEGAREACDQQHQYPGNDSLKRHFLFSPQDDSG